MYARIIWHFGFFFFLTKIWHYTRWHRWISHAGDRLSLLLSRLTEPDYLDCAQLSLLYGCDNKKKLLRLLYRPALPMIIHTSCTRHIDSVWTNRQRCRGAGITMKREETKKPTVHVQALTTHRRAEKTTGIWKIVLICINIPARNEIRTNTRSVTSCFYPPA